MNPNDIFWVARYAHRVLAPLMPPAHRFAVTLQFGGNYPGVDIWLYGPDTDRSMPLPFRLGCTTRGQVDAFVEKVKELASVAA